MLHIPILCLPLAAFCAVVAAVLWAEHSAGTASGAFLGGAVFFVAVAWAGRR